jgi:hypothetical protein
MPSWSQRKATDRGAAAYTATPPTGPARR